MFRVGLTGGIASGKTTVAELFAALGVPVIDTDRIAHEIVAPGSPGLAAVLDAFGTAVRRPDGGLDRQALRKRVFARPGERARLEGLLHPLILAELETRSAAAGGPYQILVIPLLVEGGLARRVNRVLVVDCPETLQIKRLLERDCETEESARRILANQATRAERLQAADDVISNDGAAEALARYVAELDRTYRILAASAKNA